MFVWSRNTVRESLHISFFCGGDPFCEVVQQPENTHREADSLLEWPVDLSYLAWATSRSPLLTWVSSGFLLSVQNYRPYIVFQVPCKNMNILFTSRIFCLSLVIGTLHTSCFFPEICWFYLQTEISVILSTGNKLPFSLSFKTTLLMLSCDCIQSVEFIIAS